MSSHSRISSSRETPSIDWDNLTDDVRAFRDALVSEQSVTRAPKAWRRIKGRLTVRHRGRLLVAWGEYLKDGNRAFLDKMVGIVISDIQREQLSLK